MLIFYYYLRKVEELLISTGIMLIALLSIINVFGRTLFGQSLALTEEITQFLVILVTFVGTSYAAGKARHIRMSAIFDALPHKGKKALSLFIAIFTAFLMFLFTAYAISYADTLRVLGTKSPALSVPYFYVYAIVPLGLFLTGIEYTLMLVKNLKEDDVYLSMTERDHLQDGGISEGVE